MKNKLALGTVQFGLNYGISNNNGEVSLAEIKKILSIATINKITLIDTAKAYGTSEKKLGEVDLSNFNIVTKLSDFNNIENNIEDSIKKLNIKKLYAVLVHDFNTFLSNQQTYNNFKSSKYFEKVEKIGFSLNKVSELEYLLSNNIKFDIIQIPYNILDQRFEVYFEELHNKGIEIHTRSVFLQGLFFMNLDRIPNNLHKLMPSIQKIHLLANCNNITVEKLALNFAIRNKYINRVVIGVTSLFELELNIKSLDEFENAENIYNHLLELKVDDENLVLPMNWNINE